MLLDQLRQAADNDDTARNVIEFVIAQDCRLFEMTVSSGVSRLVEPSLASPADAARETRTHGRAAEGCVFSTDFPALQGCPASFHD